MDVVSARISGIFGPLYHSMANLPSRLTHAAVKGEEPNFGGGPRGGGVPFEEDAGDLCYVKDCGKGLQLLQMADKLQHRIYNVASEVTTSNRQLVDAVMAAVPGTTITLQPGRGPTWRPNACLDISRLRAETGYEPRYTIDSAIADYVAWLRHNPQ